MFGTIVRRVSPLACRFNSTLRYGYARLSTTAADFVDFADRLERVASDGSVAVVGSERALAEANEELPEGERLAIRNLLG